MGQELTLPQTALIAAARLEAASRTRGASNRYLMASAGVSEGYARARLRRNLWRNRTLRRSAVSLAVAVAVALLATPQLENVSEWTAEKIAAAKELIGPRVTAIRSWNLGKHPHNQLASPIEHTDGEHEAQTSQPKLSQNDGTTATREQHELGNAVEVELGTDPKLSQISLPVLMPSPIPGAPLETLLSSQSMPPEAQGRVRLVEEAPLPLDATNLVPTAGKQDGQDAAVSNELRAAIDEARTRRASSPAASPTPRKSTLGGVDVQLRKRSTPESEKVEPMATQPDPHIGSTDPASSFSVVSSFPGGLIVRIGREVKPVLVGETLPNGKRLTQIDESGSNHVFE